MIAAMKEKNAVRLASIRAIKAAILLAGLAEGRLISALVKQLLAQ